MDNLRKSIKLIFFDLCPDSLLKHRIDSSINFYINSETFLERGFNLFTNYSIDEILNIYDKLEKDWFIEPKGKSFSYFNILTHFTSKVLIEENLEPFVRYEHLLKWRNLSYQITEDLLTCSYFAYMDSKSLYNRDYFAWRPVIFSNNKQLKSILNKGLAENHFHLKGSGPVFELSWINLMNNIQCFPSQLEKLDKEMLLSSRYSNLSNQAKKSIKFLTIKAAYLRQKLFYKLILNSTSPVEIDISKNSNKDESNELLVRLSNLNSEIQVLKNYHGYQFRYKNNWHTIDYAITHKLHSQNLKASYVFCGERQLLYSCFKAIYQKNEVMNDELQRDFHAYLLIKSQFRSELIQVNDKVGFGNFSKYQERKEMFLQDESIYHSAFINLAVNDTLLHNRIDSFEVRVAPKETLYRLAKSLKGYSETIKKQTITPFNEFFPELTSPSTLNVIPNFYTIHFVKKKDKKLGRDTFINDIICRHNELRNAVKLQSIAISKIRESYSQVAETIRGIDAASSEFDAPPEVFAQAFRYLKNHRSSGNFNHLKEKITEHQLYATFHAGEDFYDLVDGLRAIDECILFLNLTHGDRIGHALALGIEVSDYYNFKHHKIMLPKQIVLDNLAWILSKVEQYNISCNQNEISRLGKMFKNLFYEVFQQYFHETEGRTKHFARETYFDAWKLRGDNPSLYLDAKSGLKDHSITFWERCGINESFPQDNYIRDNEDIRFLYQQYHFNSKVKSKGLEIKQFDITQQYIKIVQEVQNCMMQEVKSKNIGIECNPTSNFLIGTFKRYSKHPITKFFNVGLENDSELLSNCPQLSVSINTDDQGIFSTSLENEYALMAIALEKEKDNDGKPKYNSYMIYDWLDKIRQMGLGQSFQG